MTPTDTLELHADLLAGAERRLEERRKRTQLGEAFNEIEAERREAERREMREAA